MPLAMNEAQRHGVIVSFDVNYRSKWWAPPLARSAVEELIPLVDLLFIGDEEVGALWAEAGEALLHRFGQRGPREVVLKRGAAGSITLVDGTLIEGRTFPVTAVDPIGAGDAFAAGYLAGPLRQVETQIRLQIANAMGAYAVMNVGDYEGLPTRRSYGRSLKGKKS